MTHWKCRYVRGPVFSDYFQYCDVIKRQIVMGDKVRLMLNSIWKHFPNVDRTHWIGANLCNLNPENLYYGTLLSTTTSSAQMKANDWIGWMMSYEMLITRLSRVWLQVTRVSTDHCLPASVLNVCTLSETKLGCCLQIKLSHRQTTSSRISLFLHIYFSDFGRLTNFV